VLLLLLLLVSSSEEIVHEHWTKMTKMTIGGHYTIRYSLDVSTQILTSNIMQSWKNSALSLPPNPGQCGKIRFPPDRIQMKK